MIAEAVSGVNVIVWFAITLGTDKVTGKPAVTGGQNHTCVAQVARELRRRNLPTSHMISVGGWDAPHPNTTLTGAEWWALWDAWNQKEVANVELGFPGYDGIDWDLEGNDAAASQWNVVTPECVDLIGTMSQAGKSAGYLMSLVPPQSYFDPTSSGFDRSLRHSYPDWHPEFHYRGRNVYTAWVSTRYGRSEVEGGAWVPTFDFVDIQLYETWSRAGFEIDGPPQKPAAEYIVELVRALQRGWQVDFGADPALGIPTQHVGVAASQLVLGFSRGSEDGSGKSVFIWPKDVATAWQLLRPDERPRGLMFWNMEIDGRLDHNTGVNGTNRTCDQARAFNEILHVRPVEGRRRQEESYSELQLQEPNYIDLAHYEGGEAQGYPPS